MSQKEANHTPDSLQRISSSLETIPGKIGISKCTALVPVTLFSLRLPISLMDDFATHEFDQLLILKYFLASYLDYKDNHVLGPRSTVVNPGRREASDQGPALCMGPRHSVNT